MCNLNQARPGHLPRCLAESANGALVKSLDLRAHDDPQLGQNGPGNKV